MTNFLELSERVEKNDLKIFDKEHDIACFIRLQYLFDKLKYFVNKIKKNISCSLKRDIFDNFRLILFSALSSHPKGDIGKLSEESLALVRFFYEFSEVSRELKIFLKTAI